MKQMPAGLPKASCLAVMDEVRARRETVVITEHGRPVAKLVSIEETKDEIYNFLQGKGTIAGDIVSPALSPQDWDKLRRFLSTGTWWLAFDQSRLSKKARAAIGEARNLGAGFAISDITLLELATLAQKGRIRLEISLESLL